MSWRSNRWTTAWLQLDWARWSGKCDNGRGFSHMGVDHDSGSVLLLLSLLISSIIVMSNSSRNHEAGNESSDGR